MEIQEILCSQTGDKCNYIKHPSGLDIYICEMNGFSTTEALFGTKYGSINTMFKTKADKEYTVVPEGIAHFLEHKLFENEIATLLHSMPKQELMQMRILPLTEHVIFTAVPTIILNRLKFC